MRLIILLLCCFCFFGCTNEKIAYIDNAKLFNSFLLKKKLQSELEKSISSEKAQIDSLEVELKILAARINSQTSKLEKEKFEQKRRIYGIYAERFEEERNKQIKSMDYQIWNQLNTYVADYGKENGLKIILASSGEGNVMFVDDDINVTDKVISYVNEKYKGNK